MNRKYAYEFGAEYDYLFVDTLYDNTNLNYHLREKNNFYYAANNYLACHSRNTKYLKYYEDIKRELASENIGMICKKELEALRNTVNSGLTYKEVCGEVKPFRMMNIWEYKDIK
jgi:hypothetical protein